jgi:iron complex outermembrane recepter protein
MDCCTHKEPEWDNKRWVPLTRQGVTTRVFDFGDGYVSTQTYVPRFQLDAEVEYRAREQVSFALGGDNITTSTPPAPTATSTMAATFRTT